MNLGRRQLEVLGQMEHNGGIWPAQWNIKPAHQPIFDSLVKRGLVRLDGSLYRVMR